jgi:uncharacterized membrane protein
MGDRTKWLGFRQLRQDGRDSAYLSVNLGKAAELIESFEPDQKVRVAVQSDGTVEISPVADADADGTETNSDTE